MDQELYWFYDDVLVSLCLYLKHLLGVVLQYVQRYTFSGSKFHLYGNLEMLFSIFSTVFFYA